MMVIITFAFHFPSVKATWHNANQCVGEHVYRSTSQAMNAYKAKTHNTIYYSSPWRKQMH